MVKRIEGIVNEQDVEALDAEMGDNMTQKFDDYPPTDSDTDKEEANSPASTGSAAHPHCLSPAGNLARKLGF